MWSWYVRPHQNIESNSTLSLTLDLDRLMTNLTNRVGQKWHFQCQVISGMQVLLSLHTHIWSSELLYKKFDYPEEAKPFRGATWGCSSGQSWVLSQPRRVNGCAFRWLQCPDTHSHQPLPFPEAQTPWSRNEPTPLCPAQIFWPPPRICEFSQVVVSNHFFFILPYFLLLIYT